MSLGNDLLEWLVWEMEGNQKALLDMLSLFIEVVLIMALTGMLFDSYDYDIDRISLLLVAHWSWWRSLLFAIILDSSAEWWPSHYVDVSIVDSFKQFDSEVMTRTRNFSFITLQVAFNTHSLSYLSKTTSLFSWTARNGLGLVQCSVAHDHRWGLYWNIP